MNIACDCIAGDVRSALGEGQLSKPKRQPKAEVALDLNQFLCFDLYSTSHAFNRVYKPLLDKIGLTYPQYLTMVCSVGE